MFGNKNYYWNYKYLRLEGNTSNDDHMNQHNSRMNRLGSMGYELVSTTTSTNNNTIFWFKVKMNGDLVEEDRGK